MAERITPSHQTDQHISGPTVRASASGSLNQGLKISPTLVSVKITGGRGENGDPNQVLSRVSTAPSDWKYHERLESRQEFLSHELEEGGFLILERRRLRDTDSPELPNPSVSSSELAKLGTRDQEELQDRFDQLKSGVFDLHNEKWAIEQIENAPNSAWKPLPFRSSDNVEGMIDVTRGYVLFGEDSAIQIRRIDRFPDTESPESFDGETLLFAEISVTRGPHTTELTGELAESFFDYVDLRYASFENVKEIVDNAVIREHEYVWSMNVSEFGGISLFAETTRVSEGKSETFTVRMTRSPFADSKEEQQYEVEVTNKTTGESHIVSSDDFAPLFERKLSAHQAWRTSPEGILFFSLVHSIQAGDWHKGKPKRTEDGMLVESFLVESDLGPVACCEQSRPGDAGPAYFFVIGPRPEHLKWKERPEAIESRIHIPTENSIEAKLLFGVMKKAMREKNL